MRGIITQLRDWVEYRLRRLCWRLPKDARIITVVILFVLLAISYMFLFVDVLLSKIDVESIKTEHIDGLRLPNRETVKPLNFHDNER